MRPSRLTIVNLPARHFEPDTVIDQSDASGLGLAALALATAHLAHDVRRGKISPTEMRAIYREARALVHDPAGFVVDPEIAQAAEDFLSVSDALAQPDALGAYTNERHRRTG